jgi:gluconolactonase
MQISKWSPSAGVSQAYDLKALLGEMDAAASTSSGIALDPQGRVVFCSSAKHAVVRIEKDGKATILAQLIDGKQLQRPNDLVIKSNGSIYFTDNSRDETGQMPPTVYLIKDGKTVPIITNLTSPNGITLSPDEKTLYVNDIRPRKVYRYDVQADDTVANGSLFVDMGGFKERGSNDGMKTDSKGNLYNTGPGGVWILAPTGKLLGTIRTEDGITNLGFGGKDGKTLFMTGHASLWQIQLKTPGQVRP